MMIQRLLAWLEPLDGGIRIDVERIKTLRSKALERVDSVKFNFESPAVCRKYLEQVLSETEKLVLRVNGQVTTKGPILEAIVSGKKILSTMLAMARVVRL